MLSALSQWLLGGLFGVLFLFAGSLIFWLRLQGRRAPADGRLCGCHTPCQEHLYQIQEPARPATKNQPSRYENKETP
ncbi:hypothetical protein [Pseudaeromonas paramecii]|uniref:FeoB-associated Cys-rich membrane protein n=1 Tax=Pseudaeromonas paramecii TaxID=2138166 RepID=A0ABP8QAK3_9GAMM